MTTNQDAISAAYSIMEGNMEPSTQDQIEGALSDIYDAMAPIIAAKAKVDALREAAEVYGAGEWVDGFMSVRDDVTAVQAIVAWLNDRAATIEGATP